MKREFPDEFQQETGLPDEFERILEAWGDYGASAYSYGLGRTDMREEEETARRTFDALFDAIITIAGQRFREGMAAGFLIAGRGDLIARDPKIEKAAAVILAEHVFRKDGDK